MRSSNLVVKKLSMLVISFAMTPLVVLTAQTAPQGKTLNLQQPFHTHSSWRFVVTEGAPTKDYGDNDAPGALALCLRKGASGPCVSAPVTPPLRVTTPDDSIAWEPHYLLTTKLVYPGDKQAAPLLLIVTGSLNSGNGDQMISTQLIAYDVAKDEFQRVYQTSVGRNNNQEVRFVPDGPLRGSVISAEPQQHLPYGYWIVVSQPTAMGEYHQVLRYGSSTRYNDGNQLAVIDSEMPAIERRLGLWKAGDPLPVPSGQAGKRCVNPVVRQDELWCK